MGRGGVGSLLPPLPPSCCLIRDWISGCLNPLSHEGQRQTSSSVTFQGCLSTLCIKMTNTKCGAMPCSSSGAVSKVRPSSRFQRSGYPLFQTYTNVHRCLVSDAPTVRRRDKRSGSSQARAAMSATRHARDPFAHKGELKSSQTTL